jgi:hypothetical protein
LTYHRSLWALKRQQLIHSDAPILVGPFEGELGIEVLYWLSFLRALMCPRHDDFSADATVKPALIDPTRVIPISRAGAAAFYGTPSGIELLAMRTMQDLRVENNVRARKTGMMKQMAWTPFDRKVIQDVAHTLELKTYQTLHPSWMYRTLHPYWMMEQGLQWLSRNVPYGFYLNPPALPEPVTLPEQFVAVKFYFRSTFPYHHNTLQLAQHAVAKLAEQQPVVILNTGLHADDHQDLAFKPQPNVILLRDLATITPENGLHWQGAVIARANGFVGTYGGLAQLAQRFARPSVTFYTDWGGTSLAHKHLSDLIAVRNKVPFVVLDIKDLPLVHSVLPNFRSAIPSIMTTQPLQPSEPVAH